MMRKFKIHIMQTRVVIQVPIQILSFVDMEFISVVTYGIHIGSSTINEVGNSNTVYLYTNIGDKSGREVCLKETFLKE